jgi:hypothetical protein
MFRGIDATRFLDLLFQLVKIVAVTLWVVVEEEEAEAPDCFLVVYDVRQPSHRVGNDSERDDVMLLWNDSGIVHLLVSEAPKCTKMGDF